ncbi:ELM1/GtrOC1 family putative glycosyltransferase [Marinobacterium sp. xm-a-152]|uniref:ELM1/GtrOC1 family putative glycosyltransferase n=1 Tax=Marinobacterium sp. xm-a-152 TaxID=2497733 RepID=UPI00156855D4|nr:ELM1/GtrOC1 family putative glycosyltransferase [Marinobacterium sp. xm-a-152]NRP15192.1 hypothetical protein [Marinobacterium sp. xm-a-152]
MIRILIVSDNRPGHERQSEGLAALLGKVKPTKVKISKVVPRSRLLVSLLKRTIKKFEFGLNCLKFFYEIRNPELFKRRFDIVISCGRDTLPAATLASNYPKTKYFFIGNVKDQYYRNLIDLNFVADVNREFGCDESIFNTHLSLASLSQPAVNPDCNNGRTLFCVGGDSGSFNYALSDWDALLAMIEGCVDQSAGQVIVTTSRRTSQTFEEKLIVKSSNWGSKVELVGYHRGDKTRLGELLARAACVVCTLDSVAMLHEAVATGLPVIGVSPENATPSLAEKRFVDYCVKQGFLTQVSLEEVSKFKNLVDLIPAGGFSVDEIRDSLVHYLREYLTVED